jgi:hypothetical protein
MEAMESEYSETIENMQEEFQQNIDTQSKKHKNALQKQTLTSTSTTVEKDQVIEETNSILQEEKLKSSDLETKLQVTQSKL